MFVKLLVYQTPIAETFSDCKVVDGDKNIHSYSPSEFRVISVTLGPKFCIFPSTESGLKLPAEEKMKTLMNLLRPRLSQPVILYTANINATLYIKSKFKGLVKESVREYDLHRSTA